MVLHLYRDKKLSAGNLCAFFVAASMGKFDEGKLPTDPHLMLRLAIETVAHDYDVIVIDSAPNLGIGD